MGEHARLGEGTSALREPRRDSSCVALGWLEELRSKSMPNLCSRYSAEKARHDRIWALTSFP
jgi:hypothetical protein